MADKNVNSEQDNAYIASLLSKLRESLGQTEPTSAVTPEASPDAAPEPGTEETVAADAPTDAHDIDDAPIADDSAPDADVLEPAGDETSASAEAVIDSEDVPGQKMPEESESEPRETVVLAQEPVSPSHEEMATESLSMPVQESALTAEPPAPESTKTDSAVTEPTVAEPATVETAGTQSSVEKPPVSATAESSTPGASYARTVQPGDPGMTGRNTTGRFLDFRMGEVPSAPAQQEKPASPFDSLFSEPLFTSHADASHDETAPMTESARAEMPSETSDTVTTSLASSDEADMDAVTEPLIFDDAPEKRIVPVGDLPTDGMPIPDSVSTPVMTQPSIWDTLPPLPHEEAPAANPAEEAAPAPELPGGATVSVSGEESSSGLFGRRTRPTFADCTFDADVQGSVMTDKILAASQDLVPETAKEKQNQLWRQELRHKRRVMRARVITVGIFLLFAIAVELIPPFPRALLSRLLLTRVPGALHLIDLQILLLAALVGAPQLVRGFAALRFRRVIPETLLLIGVTVSALAGIYLTAVDLAGKYFCALPAVLMIFTSLMGDLFRLRSLSHAFDSYTAKGHHFCAVYSDVREHPLLGTEFRDAKNPHLFETASASGIDHFVAASRRRVECRRASWITLAIAGAAAVISLILSLATHTSAQETIWAFTLTLVGVMPLTLFGAHRYLFAMLTSRVSEERVGIADETTVYEYAHTGVMTFEDTEAFPAGSVQLSGIKLCGDFRLDKALYLTASVFDVVGGPLNGVFRLSTSDINISDNVDIRALYADGIDARVNHDDVLIGTKAFLESRGVSVFRDVEDERAEQGRSGVLYLAYMGTLSAKFHLNYHMSDAFETNIEYYAKHGVASAILTADPLLNRAFLDRISYVSEYDVRVVKKTREALMEEEEKTRDATLITFGPRKTLRRMPFFFSAYAKYQAIVIGVMIAMASLAAVYVPVLLCLMKSVVPWLSFTTQLLAALPCVIFGFLLLRLNPNK